VNQMLTNICNKACAIKTECDARHRPQSITCSDSQTRSALTIHFAHSAQGIAFVTDHVIPAGSALSCDWCVCYCDESKTSCNGMLIELKGRDFRHAVQQLASTYSAMRATWPLLKIVRCHAVLSGCRIPSVKSGDYKVVEQYKLPNFKHYRARRGLMVEV
jgi:hypothetical protein